MRNTVQYAIKSFSVLLLFAVLALASDVPWKGKSYDQWTAKDVEQVLTNSPWARKTNITRTWNRLTQPDLPNATVSGAARGMPGNQGPNNENAGSELTIDVYWASSRVIRAASARKAILQGGKKDVDVEKYANEPQREYAIVVQSEDMTPFVQHDEKSFQADAFLETKKNKLKLASSQVRYERDEKGLVSVAIFFFPKKTPSGDPTISSDEKAVEFNCKIEGATLRVSFAPQKMVDNQGPAL
jgi:hypothetical protein